MKKSLFLLALLMSGVFMACTSDDETNNESGKTVVTEGIYVMCEGNWGSNTAAIDYLDIATLEYTQNIFAKNNPQVVMGLGDTSTDMQINGNQLWVVVNNSNKVEVLSAETCKRIAKLDIANCRYVTFYGNYAYVSSYVGPVAEDNVQLGTIYKIDTRDFRKTDSVVVGYQPEEMAIVDNKLYVACSGGYRYPVYDRVVSAVDLATFKKTNDIDVAVNLHRLRKDSYNQLWVSSRGNYQDVVPSLSWMSKDASGNMKVEGRLDIAVSDLCIVGDSLYYVGTVWDNATMSNTISYGIINTKTHKQVATTIFSSQDIKNIEMPYGIMVNPEGRDFYITDAKNYTSSGKLYHFSAEGNLLWEQWTSDIPSKMLFYKTEK